MIDFILTMWRFCLFCHWGCVLWLVCSCDLFTSQQGLQIVSIFADRPGKDGTLRIRLTYLTSAPCLPEAALNSILPNCGQRSCHRELRSEYPHRAPNSICWWIIPERIPAFPVLFTNMGSIQIRRIRICRIGLLRILGIFWSCDSYNQQNMISTRVELELHEFIHGYSILLFRT